MTAIPPVSRHGESGFSYIELLVTTVFIALMLMPALETLQTGVQGAGLHESRVIAQYQLMAIMEEVLAEPFQDLENAAQAAGGATILTSYSDAPATPNRRLVFLSRYDGDNADGNNDPFTGTDDGLLWVRVEIEDSEYALETLTNHDE